MLRFGTFDTVTHDLTEKISISITTTFCMTRFERREAFRVEVLRSTYGLAEFGTC